MKKFILLTFILISFISCREDTVQYTIDQSTADVIINSNPRKALIYLNNINSGKITPDTLKNLNPGSYLITLKLDGYRDSSTTISVEAEQDQSVFVLLKTR